MEFESEIREDGGRGREKREEKEEGEEEEERDGMGKRE